MAKTRLCEVCKQQIEETRAAGMPETRLCGQHAEEINKYGGEFLTSGVQERTSKVNSMKVNYGGIITTKRRNVEGVQRLRDEFMTR